jgi:hypothetical protein
MNNTKLLHRYKWKQKALMALYIIFLLATVGEFFYALNHSKVETEHQVEVENEIEIPPHLPEESKLEFIRIARVKGSANWRYS